MNFISRTLFPLFTICCVAMIFNSCTAQRMRAEVRASRVVVLDIGHSAGKAGLGNGARTPDERFGLIEESMFWYRYVIYTKRIIEQAGYTCIITNRGASPHDPELAQCGREAGVVQINTPTITGVYRSTQHPRRMAVGMLSVNYALDQKPACVVFLHHNSNAAAWQKATSSTVYTNQEGIQLATQMAQVMNESILDHGMPNDNVNCQVMIRDNGRLGGGDWLNACNDSYVPAAITEVAYLNNPEHARYLSQKKNARAFAEAVGRGIIQHLQTR